MIEVVPETGSTNADLAARLQGGEYLREGHWLVADRQTAGRGRLGRVWNDGAGNFMGSTIVKVEAGDAAPATLALLAGLSVHRALTDSSDGKATFVIKWPNDIMVGRAKVAGILLEMRGNFVIVGVGVNLATAPQVPGREVATIAGMATPPSRDVFAATLQKVFAEELGRWRAAGLAPLLRRWQAAAHPHGTQLNVHPPGEEPVTGAFSGLSEDGDLKLLLPDGQIRIIGAGDVLLACAAT